MEKNSWFLAMPLGSWSPRILCLSTSSKKTSRKTGNTPSGVSCMLSRCLWRWNKLPDPCLVIEFCWNAVQKSNFSNFQYRNLLKRNLCFPFQQFSKQKNANETQKEKEQKAPVQQREGLALGRQRAWNRAVWQASEHEAVAGSQVEEGLRPKEKQGGWARDGIVFPIFARS